MGGLRLSANEPGALMDAQTRGNVVATLRWLASELARDRHGLAHVPMELAAVVADGRPASAASAAGDRWTR
jgi:hypothetical protein